jgi:hypothetical protein
MEWNEWSGVDCGAASGSAAAGICGFRELPSVSEGDPPRDGGRAVSFLHIEIQKKKKIMEKKDASADKK